MQEDRIKRFNDFVDWFNKHIKGYEKGEGQIFFNRLLQAFGNTGILEVGATCEERVKKRKGTTGFADFVWKPRVVIELKERGTALHKHYEQAFEYWWTLVPNRPQYMVLCNFDEFWVYDLNTQINDPVHVLKTTELVKDWGALAFLFPKAEKPVFNNNNVEVTVEAAQIIGSMFFSMSKRKIEPLRAQRFVLQIVVALFAEDVGLIPKYTIHKILGEAVKNSVTQKEITDLFQAMSTQVNTHKPKKYKDIPYFNGGIFNEVDAIELNFKELDLLYEASKQDWSKVRPSIFGSIFESSMDQDKRHNLGAHFTSEIDIQKIVFPTIVKPFREKIEKAAAKQTAKALKAVLKEIHDYKVLDPACGSGNFLYVAFRELRRLEVEVLELLSEQTGSKQTSLAMVSPKNFYGIDVNGFGLELAKVALCIGRKLSADEFKIQDHVLPFENLDENFLHVDALFNKWPEVDAIVGNPPFLGKRVMRDELGNEYVDKLRQKFKGVPENIDFCSYWFRLAHESKTKYCGLVGTNSVSQGFTREATLDYILNNKGYIHYAISTQEWSGEAAVHVSIINWSKAMPKQYILDGVVVDSINSSLKNEADVTQAYKLSSNSKKSFVGSQLTGKDFIITEELYKSWIKQDVKNRDVLVPMVDGRSVVNPNLMGEYVIDFYKKSIEEASKYQQPFNHVKLYVKPFRDKKKDKALRDKWWIFERPRVDMREALSDLDSYFAISQVSKYTIFRAIPANVLPCEATMVIASDDFYILGILNSKLHTDWVKAQGSTLKGDQRYTNTTCFETFPFLESKKSKTVNEIRSIAKELEHLKNTETIARKISVTEFYNQFIKEPTSQLHILHEKLNRSCCDHYGWKYDPTKNYNDQLFKLNQEMFKKEAGSQSSFLEMSSNEDIPIKKMKKLKKKAK
jgi:hypothetical protein